MFGMNQPSNTLFGTSNASQTNTFGSTQPFGSTSMFGNTAQQSTSLFGNTNRFGMNSTTGFSSTLGQTVNVPVGTTVKFVPQTSTDTIIKNGHTQSTSISIRLQCITCMREYESKSLEELRLEDYQANRKGPQANTLFSSGTMNTGFGNTSNVFNTANTNQPSLFSQNKLPFNSIAPTTTTSAFGLDANKTGAFGLNSATQQTPFNSISTSTSLFNTNPTNTNTTFDPKNTFGATAFNANANKPAFGGFAGFGSSATTNTLTNPTNTSNFLTSQPSFQFSNSLSNTGLGNKPSFPSFSAPQNTGFNLGTNTSTSNMFGTTGNTFGSNTGTSLFNPIQSNSFSFGSTTQPFQNTNTSFQLSQPSFGGSTLNTSNLNNSQQMLNTATASPNTDQIITRLQTLPYGSPSQLPLDSSFNMNNIRKTKFTTDPKTLNQYKINAKSQKEVKVQRVPANGNPSTLLFDGLDDESPDNLKCAQDIFQPRQNIKKLVLNKSSNSPLLKTTIIKSSIVSEPAINNDKENELPLTSEPSKLVFDDTIDVINKLSSGGDDPVPKLAETSKSPRISSLTYNVEPETTISVVPKCGVILTRSDYYTIPTLEECDSFYNPDDDTCIVDSFTVGRIDYGSIFWKGPLNVKGLNLDEIVHIRRKEVIVYPDDEAKPAQGEGLNRPAQVTLDQVWPIDKATREFIKDAARLRTSKYYDKIESATIKLGAVFKEYRPDTGSWVFCVKHFSKYGLDVEDDELEMENVADNCQTKKNQFEQKDLKLSGSDNVKLKPDQGLFKAAVGFDKNEPFTDGLPSDRFASNQSGMLSYGNYEAFFEDDTMNEDKLNQSSKLKDPMDEEFDIMRTALFVDNDEEEVETATKKCKNLSFTKSVTSNQVLPPLLPNKFIPANRKRRNLTFEPKFAPHKANIYSVGHSRSPRVSFANGSNKYCLYLGSDVLVFELDLVELNKNDALTKLEYHFIKNSSIEQASNDNCPPLIKTNQYSLNEKTDSSRNALIEALYGELKEKSYYSRHQERIIRIQNWLFDYNRRLPVPELSFRRIMHFLTTNELEFAITECLNSKQPRLSCLIATGAYCNKSLIFSQLDYWKRSGADVYISKDLLKIYILLAGLIQWTRSDGQIVNQLEGLKWTQQLALIMLYKSRDEEESEIIGTNLVKSSIEHILTVPNTVEYHLLAQHQPWVAIGCCTDLISSWFLHEALLSYNVIMKDIYTNKSDYINLFLASQVKNLRWALFFILHIKNDFLRLSFTKEVLARNVTQLDEALENYLHANYGINQQLIAEAKLYHSMATFDYKETAFNLINCGNFYEAHQILIDKVFPELVINESFDEIIALLKLLKSEEKSIPNWNLGGAGIYEIFIQMLQFDSDADLKKYKNLVENFNVHLLQCPTKRHILCQSQMTRVANIIHAELNDGMYAYKTTIPDDYVLIELRSNANKILDLYATNL